MRLSVDAVVLAFEPSLQKLDSSFAQVLGTFGTGRLEAFLPQKCLEPDQLKDPKVAAAIGRTMCRFHAIAGPVRSRREGLKDTLQD